MPNRRYTLIHSIKIAISVFFCMLIFHFIDRGAPVVASLAAVAPLLTSNFHATVKVGVSSLVGNIIGGIMALLYFWITESIHDNFTLELLILPLFIILVVLLCELVHDNKGLVSAISTTILICLSVSYNESFAFALDRTIDTFIGTLVAISINFLIHPTKAEIQQQIKEDQRLLQQKQSELTKLSNEVDNKKGSET